MHFSWRYHNWGGNTGDSVNLSRIKTDLMKIALIDVKLFSLAAGMLLSILTTNAQVQIGADINGDSTYDALGFSVSMPDAYTLAVGAVFTQNTQGYVKVYTFNGAAWIQKGVDIDGEAAGDWSGVCVSMPDSNTIAIGAHQNDGGGFQAGQVRVYTWSGTAWIQKGVDIDGEAVQDHSGWDISMPDANTVAIGAYMNGGNGWRAGHVRVYTWSGTAWAQKGVDIDGEAAGDASGISVSMPDANTLAIGATTNSVGGIDAGHVRVYTWSGAAWVQKGVDIDGEAAGDASGWDVSMPDSNTLAIAGRLNYGGGIGAGHVRIYNWSGSAWVQKGADIDGAAGDYSGWSVSMPDANTLAVGAPFHSDTGHVRVYMWSGTAWIQKGVDIDGEAAENLFGFSVSMADANTLAIGAPWNDGGGIDAGHVRVYTFTAFDVSENSLSSLLKLYPNPTSNILNVEVGGEYLNTAYSIFENTGRVVLTGTLHSEVTSIQLGDLSSGVYTISVGDCIRQIFKVSRG